MDIQLCQNYDTNNKTMPCNVYQNVFDMIVFNTKQAIIMYDVNY